MAVKFLFYARQKILWSAIHIGLSEDLGEEISTAAMATVLHDLNSQNIFYPIHSAEYFAKHQSADYWGQFLEGGNVPGYPNYPEPRWGPRIYTPPDILPPNMTTKPGRIISRCVGFWDWNSLKQYIWHWWDGTDEFKPSTFAKHIEGGYRFPKDPPFVVSCEKYWAYLIEEASPSIIPIITPLALLGALLGGFGVGLQAGRRRKS